MSIENPGDNARCDHCNRPGTPYTYNGQTFSGLTPVKGDRLCPGCRDLSAKKDLHRPAGETLWVPPEHRGKDGQGHFSGKARRRK